MNEQMVDSLRFRTIIQNLKHRYGEQEAWRIIGNVIQTEISEETISSGMTKAHELALRGLREAEK